MSAPELWTYRDVIDSLVDYLGGASDERNRSQVRRSILNAYRDVVQVRNWNYYYGVHRVQLVALYATGTITYDHTGGASERLVTLSGGTWPTWSIYGHIDIGGIISRVATRDSDTAITLESIQNPGADVASGTSYTIYRDMYTLPSDFRAMARPSGESNWWYSSYISPEEWMFFERNDLSSGTPTCWTVLGDSNLIGSSAIAVYPYPDAAQTFDFVYQRYARPLVKTGYATAETAGTATVGSGAVEVTMSTAAPAGVNGSILRFGDTSNVPDGLGGKNPFVEQKVIMSGEGTTTLVIDSAVGQAFTTVKYCISDPVDMPPKLLTAFIRKCEAELSVHKERGNTTESERRYKMALMAAFDADCVMFSSRVASGGATPVRGSLRDMTYTYPS